MKTANVASVRDLGPLDRNEAAADPPAALASVPRMSDILRRYPDVGEEERQALIHFLKNGSQEDIAQAAYVDGLEPRLIAFRKDHPEHFPAGLKAWGPLALLVLVPLLAVLWRFLA